MEPVRVLLIPTSKALFVGARAPYSPAGPRRVLGRAWRGGRRGQPTSRAVRRPSAAVATAASRGPPASRPWPDPRLKSRPAPLPSPTPSVTRVVARGRIPLCRARLGRDLTRSGTLGTRGAGPLPRRGVGRPCSTAASRPFAPPPSRHPSTRQAPTDRRGFERR